MLGGGVARGIELGAHAQSGAPRFAGRFRRRGRLAARRGGSGRRRGPVRADRAATRAGPLYCYRAADRAPSSPSASDCSAASPPTPPPRRATLPDVDVLPARRGRRPQGRPALAADAALQAFLAAVWADARTSPSTPAASEAPTPSSRQPRRGCSLTVVLTPVEGLVIESDEVASATAWRSRAPAPCATRRRSFTPTRGRRSPCWRSRPQAGEGPPLEARGPPAAPAPDRAAPVGRRRARARPDRLGAHGRRAVAGRPAGHRPAPGERRLPACAEEEDPLRAFCSLVARRTPRRASSRGRCGASSSAASADLPRGADGLAARRPRRARRGGRGRIRAQVGADRRDLRRPRGPHRSHRPPPSRGRLERAVVAGLVRPDPRRGPVSALGDNLRAVLRDVLCGHLEPDLRRVADALLADVAPVAP